MERRLSFRDWQFYSLARIAPLFDGVLRMNWLDFAVLIGSLLGIAIYGIWQTRHRRDLNSYLKGSGQTPWFAIGLSVMATQASAVTFLSTPGQGYVDGLGFVQIYFGVPIALIVICIFFLPI